jgi:hypothetical protein
MFRLPNPSRNDLVTMTTTWMAQDGQTGAGVLPAPQMIARRATIAVNEEILHAT